MVSVGVLALQGDFAEHVSVMQELGVNTLEVRHAKEFDQIDALIIPGGESTTMARLLDLDEMRESLVRYAKEGMPVWGTCAGMIMLSTWVSDGRPEPLGLMDIKVSRNAFGRQVDSFEAALDIPVIGEEKFHAVFIRAPIVDHVEKTVTVLGRLDDSTIVAVKQNSLLATSFHPELTKDYRLHEYFLEFIHKRK
ncbi:MAG: pyridoxal 5'-phosphate synthase glutaminase subunit PdxT [Dehalococcoidia bacterium]|nr:pyridoxal 5'-phosphate synthase glutaminase subunit PdxT [Dehalococcoidia bacterium]